MPEPITVKITDDTGTQNISIGSTSNNQTKDAKKGIQNAQTKSNEKNSQLVAAGTYIAMQTANYVTSNIGKYTGNKGAQTQINNAKRIAGYGVALATNFWLGLAVIAVDGATSIADYMYDRKWDQIRSSQALARTGDLGGFRR